MDEMISQIQEAAASHDWLTVIVGTVLVTVPVVLKALGRSVPILDQVLGAGGSILKFVKGRKKDAPAPQPGVSSVVDVVDEEKKT